MDFSEPANWARIRSDAEEIVARYVAREVIENERRTGDGADRELTRKLGERGWIAPVWPVEEGGAGLDHFETAVLHDTLRRGGVPTIGPGTTMLPARFSSASATPNPRADLMSSPARPAPSKTVKIGLSTARRSSPPLRISLTTAFCSP